MEFAEMIHLMTHKKKLVIWFDLHVNKVYLK